MGEGHVQERGPWARVMVSKEDLEGGSWSGKEMISKSFMKLIVTLTGDQDFSTLLKVEERDRI